MDYETMGEEVLGDDLMGDSTVGVVRRVPQRRGVLRLPPKPAWRSQVASGVPGPGIGLQPLPLTPSANGGVFDAANPAITFSARPQAPFRGERLLVRAARSAGAGAVLILARNFFVGRELQLVELGSFDLEFFSPTAFGVRLNLVAAEPGVLITIDAFANPVVPGGETVGVSIMLLGHTVR